MSSEHYIGQRLSYDGNLCTVRYIGKISTTNGVWLGVEWDDPRRGKHDGAHDGKRYFNCLRNHATTASFVRPVRPSDPCRNFVEALTGKYASDATVPRAKSAASVKNEDIIRISGKEVEEVGFDKIRRQLANLHQLRIVILDNFCIHRPVDRRKAARDGNDPVSEPRREDVATACPSVVDLDVSRNCFEEWTEVEGICRQLSNLTSLRADGNRFNIIRHFPRPSCLHSAPFENIRTLSLDDTLLSWEDVCWISITMPSLTSLSARGNQYRTLEKSELPASLSTLSLERNNFTSLQQLQSLVGLHQLERLSLKECSINSVGTGLLSSSLADVDLSSNSISQWKEIDALAASLPKLTSLRVSHNPLYSGLISPDGQTLAAEDGYMLTIARLGRLQRLNFSPIVPKERLNAETYYLSLIGKQLSAAAAGERESILAEHARFDELCRIYGEPIVKAATKSSIDPRSLAAGLVRVRFHLGSAFRSAAAKHSFSDIPNESSWDNEVPRSCNIYTVLSLVGKRLRVSPMLLELIWETGEPEVPARESDDDDDFDDESPFAVSGRSNTRSRTRPDSLGRDDGGIVADDYTLEREERLVPRIRSLATWIERRDARIRVEWSLEDLRRRTGALAAGGSGQ